MRLRLSLVVVWFVAFGNGLLPCACMGQDPTVAPTAPADSSAPKISNVVLVERPGSVANFAADPNAIQSMFTLGLTTLTGQPDAASAWKSLGIVPDDVVGIKITTEGGTVLSTHPDLVRTIIDGLTAAGVPPGKIIIWDKFSDQMRPAGWTLTAAGNRTPAVQSVVPGTGFDPRVFYVNEILGRLIWGDQQFQGTRPTAVDLMAAARRAAQAHNPVAGDDDGGAVSPVAVGSAPSPDQTSNKSFYALLMTQTCSKIINVPVLSDSTNTGLSGCLSSLALGCVDNTRRFCADPSWGDPAVPEILDKDFIRKKVILHVLDAYVAQYAGGPRFNPVFTQSIGALYLSKDPVAIDTLALRRIEAWRKDNFIDPLGKMASHVATAATYDLGQTDLKKIELIKLP